MDSKQKCLLFPGAYHSTLKMEATCSSKMLQNLPNLQVPTRCCSLEDSSLTAPTDGDNVVTAALPTLGLGKSFTVDVSTDTFGPST